MRSNFRQFTWFHSTVVFKLVLDICTHYLRLFLPNYRESVSISLALPRAFASDSIFPTRCIRLAPATGIRPPESKREVTSFRMTILCTFRVMLFAGFMGGACWSNGILPTPYPVPFGSSVFILISLVLGNDESDTSSSNCFTHGYFAQWIPN